MIKVMPSVLLHLQTSKIMFFKQATLKNGKDFMSLGNPNKITTEPTLGQNEIYMFPVSCQKILR